MTTTTAQVLVPVHCGRCGKYLCHTNAATTVAVGCPYCVSTKAAPVWTKPPQVQVDMSALKDVTA